MRIFKQLIIIFFCFFLVGCEKEEKQYSVTFKDYDGTILKEETVLKNSSAMAPIEPTRDGYKFVGWSISFDNVTSDLIVVAKYEIESKQNYSVSFDTNGGNLINSIKIEHGSTIEEPIDPVKEGNTFLGWYYNDEKWDFINSPITENITLLAKWQVNQYTITFDTDGGTHVASINQDYGTKISIPNDPIKDYCSFKGWEEEIPSTMPAKNMTLKAIWYDVTDDFKVSENTIVEYVGDSSNVIIPSNYGINGKLIEITNIESYAFFSCSSLISIIIPEGVTNIGNYAFFSCPNLKNLIIPNSMKMIDNYIFYECTNLEYNIYENAKYLGNETNPYLVLVEVIDINIRNCEINPNTKFIMCNAFSSCKEIVNINIPKKVISIGDYCFAFCPNLKNITIPEGVKSIGEAVFMRCSSLTSITIPESVTSIGDYAFSNCSRLVSITIPESVTSIGDYAFSNCNILTSITIPDNVISIGMYTFRDCSNLTSIDVDSNNLYYKSIEGNLYTKDGKTLIQYAIGKKQTEFIIPENVTNIGLSAFSGCSNLSNITIPESVTNIGHHALYDCDSLNYYIYDNAKYLGNEANPYLVLVEGIDYNITSCEINPNTKFIIDYAFYGCNKLTNIIIPEEVISIGGYAFAECNSLVSITIPEGVTSIGDWTFHSCSNLKNITIPKSITSIGEEAFYDCGSLANITIPQNVISIGDHAFYNCSTLTSITIPESVTNIGDWTFYGCSNLTSIDVDSNNLYYKSIEGNLYTRDGKILIQYAIGKQQTEFIIPENVTSIKGSAFSKSVNLTNIIISNNVTNIEGGAFDSCVNLEYNIYDNAKYLGNESNPYLVLVRFINNDIISCEINPNTKIINSRGFYNCKNLTNIIIPESVIFIGDMAFAECVNLSIYCEVKTQPRSWDLGWKVLCKCSIIWGYNN